MAILSGAASAGTVRAHASELPRLATGPFAVLQAVLRKSLLRLEVVRVQIRVDQETQHELAAMVSGREQTKSLADGVVRSVMATKDAIITAELRRDVGFDAFAQSTYANLRSAREAALISDDSYWSLARLLPQWFRAFQDRGARKGDRLMCQVHPDSMRLLYRTVDTVTLIDQTVPDGQLGRAVLASYLAPESSFRKELVGSLFR